MLISVKNEKHWREMRAQYIGASEVPALFVKAYSTPWQIWMAKTGKLKSEEKEEDGLLLGRFYEEATAKAAMEKWRNDFAGMQKSHFYAVADRESTVQEERCLGLGASLDYFVKDGDKIAPVEIKNVWWGKGWDFTGETINDVPSQYIIQVQSQLACLGSDAADHGWIIAAKNSTLFRVKIPRNDRMIEAIFTAVDNFRLSMKEGREPDLNSEKDSKYFRSMYIETDKNKVLHVHDDKDVVGMVAEYHRINDLRKNLEKQEKEIGDKFARLMQDCGKMYSGDFEVVKISVEGSDPKIITPDMVGTEVGGRKPYIRFSVKQAKVPEYD